MPKEVTDEEYAELQSLRSSSVGKDLEIARANFRAENPHVPVTLVSAYSGDPAGMEAFGKALLEQFPRPQPAPPVAPPVAASVAPPAAQAPQAALQSAPPAPAAPPALAIQPQAQRSPAEVALQYAQQAAAGVAQIPGMVPAPAPVPSPGSADSLTPQNATKAESEKIRELMRIGRATPQQVQWLSQWGEHGFTAAMTDHARKVGSVVGRH